MRRIGLAVILTLSLTGSLTLAPLAVEAQDAAKGVRIGYWRRPSEHTRNAQRPSVKGCVTLDTSRTGTS
jgi:hypothetical protein